MHLVYRAVSHLASDGCSQVQLGVGAHHRLGSHVSQCLLPEHSGLVLLVVMEVQKGTLNLTGMLQAFACLLYTNNLSQ